MQSTRHATHPATGPTAFRDLEDFYQTAVLTITLKTPVQRAAGRAQSTRHTAHPATGPTAQAVGLGKAVLLVQDNLVQLVHVTKGSKSDVM